MWIVYNKEDSWSQGYSVASETEAEDICKREKEMTYLYVDMALLTA